MKIRNIIPTALLALSWVACEEKVESDSLSIDDLSDMSRSDIGIVAGARSYIDLSRGIQETGASAVIIKVDPNRGDLTYNESNFLIYNPVPSFIEGFDEFEIEYLGSSNESLRANLFRLNIVDPSDTTSIPCLNGALPDYFDTYRDETLIMNVLGNDGICPDQIDDFEISILEEPSNGTVHLVASDSIMYVPELSDTISNQTLVYSLELTDLEGNIHVSAAEVYIHIYQDSVHFCQSTISNDVFQFDTDSLDVSNIPISLDVLSNDNICNQIIGSFDFTQPAHGSVTLDGDASLWYTPDEGFTGTDEFEYTICTNGEPDQCGSASVSLVLH
jgi:hypothetical protein